MSNMYEFVKTRNYIGGECLHGCKYCYVQAMKKRNPTIAQKYSGNPFLCDKEFKKGLGKNNTWFIGSMIDMFAENIPVTFISTVIETLTKYDNTYFFQSKNPLKFTNFKFPKRTILCTTIESNREYPDIYRFAPKISQRFYGMSTVGEMINADRMVTIEPILDFDFKAFVKIIEWIQPIQVNIGANSKNNNLPEPSADKIIALISELEKFTKVHQKPNLKRLLLN